MSYYVEGFDLLEIGNAAHSLATIGRKMPPQDAYKTVVGSWQLEVSDALTRMERLLNPKRIPFGDERRIHFPGPSAQSRAIGRLRNSIDRILKTLHFEDVADRDYPCGEPGEHLRGPMANHPRMEERDQIKPEEWQRIEEEAQVLLRAEKEQADKPDTTQTAANKGQSKYAWGNDDPETPLTPAKLADRLGIPADDKKTRERLRGRLRTWRNANQDGGWFEVADRKAKQARYLFPIGKVWATIEDLKSSG